MDNQEKNNSDHIWIMIMPLAILVCYSIVLFDSCSLAPAKEQNMFKYKEELQDLLVIDEAGNETISSLLTVRKDGPKALVVGFGHDILPKDDLELGDKITFTRAIKLFEQDTFKAIAGTYEIVPYLDNHPEPVQIVLVSLCFQLGTKGLSKFKHMLSSIEQKDYNTAAKHLLDSKMARYQSSARAHREAAMLRLGEADE